jgi:8-oxo-dGTP diphosphatase
VKRDAGRAGMSADRKMMVAVIDRCWRVAYWIGFRLMRLWWWLRRPDHRGALVAIWFGGRILTVRQSYRANLSWPGGGIRRGEDPRDAACRELAEELGLVVSPSDLALMREMTVDCDFCRDHVSVFELHLQAEPLLTIDNREIVAAHFVEPRELLLQKRLSPIIRACFEDWVHASERGRALP